MLLSPITIGGKAYLVEILGAKPEQVFARPYLVPDPQSLLQYPSISTDLTNSTRPIFLCVGQLIPRKGIRTLLKACHLLQQQSQTTIDSSSSQMAQQSQPNFTVLIAGSGWESKQLAELAEKYNLSSHIVWLGEIDYGNLGFYYQYADVLLFPTLEDIWGMVVPEGMNFGKPVICSKSAGSVELIDHKSNGYSYDPGDFYQLASYMNQFIEHPELIKTMGQKSLEMIELHSPQKAAQSLAKVISASVRTRIN